MAEKLKVAGLRLVIEGAAQFNSTITGVNSKLQLSQAQFAKLQAEYGRNSTSVEFLAGKQKFLQEKLAATKQIGEQYNRILEETVAKYGENSAEADKVRAAIAKNEAEQIKLEKQLEETTKQLQIQSSQWTKVGNTCKEVGEKMGKVGEKMVSVGTKIAAVGTAVVGAISGLAIAAGKSADELNTLAKQTGFSTSELQKMKYAADRVDVSTESIIGAVKKMKKNMASESAATIELWERLGVAVHDSSGEYRKATDVFYEALEGLSKIKNETERDIVAQQLFGKSADELAGIVDDGGAALKAYGDEMERLGLVTDQKALDSANQLNDVIDGTKAKFLALKDVLGAKLAEAIAPHLDNITNAIDRFIKKVLEINPDQLLAIGKIGLTIAGIGTSMTLIGKALGVLKTILTAFGELSIAIGAAKAGTGALAGVFTALTGPVGIIIGAISGLIAIFAVLYKTDNEFAESVKKTWASIRDSLSGVCNSIKQTLQPFFATIKQWWSDHGQTVLGIVTKTFEGILTAIDVALKLISGAIQLILAVIKGDWSGAFDAIKNTTAGVFDSINNLTNGKLAEIAGKINSFVGKAKEAFSGMATRISDSFNSAVNKISSFATRVSDVVSSVKTKVKNAFDNMIAKAVDWGTNLISAFVRGIKNSIGKVVSAVKNVVSTVKDYLGFSSPAKKGEGRFVIDWGENMVSAFIDGMNSMSAQLAIAASAMSSVASAGLQSSTTNDNRSYSYGGVTVQNLTVRNDNDIKVIAQELYNLQTRNARGMAVIV